MSTPRKTKRPALGSKPLAYAWAFVDEHGKIFKTLRGLPFLTYRCVIHQQIRVAIVPVTRGKKKARAK